MKNPLHNLSASLLLWAFAGSAAALTPARVEVRFSMKFARGAVALAANERERLVMELGKVPYGCTGGVMALGHGDAGLPIKVERALAIERARYVRDLAARVGLRIDYVIGEDVSQDHERIGTTTVAYERAVPPWCTP